MSTVIKVENLSKRYRLGVINRDMLYKDLQSRWAKFRGKEDQDTTNLLWATAGDRSLIPASVKRLPTSQCLFKFPL